MQAAVGVAVGDPHVHRSPAFVAGERGHATHRHLRGSVGNVAFLRAGGAITGQRDHNDIRLDLFERLVT